MLIFKQTKHGNYALTRLGPPKAGGRELVQDRRQIPRKLIEALDLFPRNRMGELDAPGMEELALQAVIGAVAALSVEWVTHKRMRDMTHMHANLVRTTRIEMAFDKGVAIVAARGLKALEHLERCDSLTCKGVVRHGHLDAVTR